MTKKMNSKLLSFVLSASMLVLLPPAMAQTWQKQGKVSLPIAALGSSCNASNDSIGLTSDRTQLLICQSGVWQMQSGSAQSTYLLVADTRVWGTQQFLGTGTVTSGVFSGVVKFPSGSQSAYQSVCENFGCAWQYTTSNNLNNNNGNYYGVSSVLSAPIISSSVAACYVLTADVPSIGTQQFLGTGTVNSGVFSGFVKHPFSQQLGGYQSVCYSWYCAWIYTTGNSLNNGNGNYYGVSSVFSLPVVSASPTACS